ncbi:MAG: hypothetical protein J5803_04820 [Desulfovibrio sp.]|nr:hypothetical protein [Desulfovibrio sp.]
MQAESLRALGKEFELVVLSREIAFLLEENGLSGGMKEAGKISFEKPKAIPVTPYCHKYDLPDASSLRIALLGDPRTSEGLHFSYESFDGERSGEENHPLPECCWQGSMEDLCSWLSSAEELVLADTKALLFSHPLLRDFLHSRIASLFDLGLACYLLRPEESDYGWAHLEAHWALPFQDGTLGKAGLALRLARSLKERLRANDLWSLYIHLELPLISVLADMEERGIAIDRNAFQLFLRDVEADLDVLQKKIFALCGGEPFNIRSSQQLGEVLFSRLNLVPPSRTKGGQIATNQQTLEKLVSAHPVITPILQFRKLEKVRSTYLDPLPKRVDRMGRLHTTFDQKGTATGRLSSHDPNLQNIPARGVLGKRMRGCFVGKEGSVLISSDYSQIELRMLAHMSQDPVMLEAFRNGVDIHAHTAALIYGVREDAVTNDQRRSAKTINFGLIYGMGATKLAQELKISTNEAKSFIEEYFSKLTGLKAFYHDIVEEAKEKGYVVTIAGRRRELPDLCSANTYLSAQAGRQAINTVIQGSAADIIKMAMLDVVADDDLYSMGARLLLQVHDELLLEVPEENAKAAGERVAHCMEGVRPKGSSLSIPLVADWGYGKSWGDAH